VVVCLKDMPETRVGHQQSLRSCSQAMRSSIAASTGAAIAIMTDRSPPWQQPRPLIVPAMKNGKAATHKGIPRNEYGPEVI
jgi:hypothetical protein